MALVGDEENRIPVVVQTGVRAGQVGLRQIDEFVFIFAGDRLATRAVQMCLHGVAFPSAFLAAFISFLYDRTLSSEPASEMSATEICVPALPKSPAAARQPFGVTAHCLPSSARKMRASCSPTPGSP